MIDAELRTMLAATTKQDVSAIGVDDDLMAKLGLDSLTGLRVLAAVEKRFGVRFPDDRLSEYRTLRQLLDVIDGKES